MPAATPGLRHRLLRAWGHQHWIRFGVRDRLLRSFAPPEQRPAPRFDVPFFGRRYRGSLESYIDWSVYFYGAYEKQEVDLLHGLAASRPDAVMLDVGANVGHHSLALSSACARIHAFEPYAPLCDRMTAALAENDVRNVTVHRVGLSDADDNLPYSPPSGANLGTGSFSNANAQAVQLEVVRGDEFLIRSGVGKVNLIKIDVEGFEKKVLAGLDGTLARHRPIVFMEFSPATRASFSGVAELLGMLPAGYRIEAIQVNLPRMGVFSHRAAKLAPFVFQSFEGNVLLLP